MNIYVGNLSKEVTQDDLSQVFGTFGEVISATIIRDKFSGESRGFGFVEMPDKAQAEKAISGVTEIKGRTVTANEARPKEARHQGGGKKGGFGRGRQDRNQRGGWRKDF